MIDTAKPKAKVIMEDGYYDPSPRRRYRYIYDPDPSPTPFPWVLLLLVGGVLLWTQPNILNNIIYLFNPHLKELEEQEQRNQLEMVKYILIIVIVCAGIYMLYWWQSRKKKKAVVVE